MTFLKNAGKYCNYVFLTACYLYRTLSPKINLVNQQPLCIIEKLLFV
jgi:hypothetical protein